VANSFSKSSQTETDLDEIWLFVATDNLSAADRLLDRINGAFTMLADNPLAGREPPELGRGIRSFPVGNYIVFYEAVTHGAKVVRVLHGARDITSEDLG
jgi:toxin ParE1/3/4